MGQLATDLVCIAATWQRPRICSRTVRRGTPTLAPSRRLPPPPTSHLSIAREPAGWTYRVK